MLKSSSAENACSLCFVLASEQNVLLRVNTFFCCVSKVCKALPHLWCERFLQLYNSCKWLQFKIDKQIYFINTVCMCVSLTFVKLNSTLRNSSQQITVITCKSFFLFGKILNNMHSPILIFTYFTFYLSLVLHWFCACYALVLLSVLNKWCCLVV